MAFIFVRIVISMTFMIAVVWLSRHSIRLYEIKVSSLFEALADVSMPEIRSSTITELWFLIHLAIMASPGWLVLSSLMTFWVLLKIGRSSILLTFRPLFQFFLLLKISLSFTGLRTRIIVKVFLASFKFTHVFNRSDRHQVKLLEIILLNNIAVGNRVPRELLSGISISCLRGHIVKLLYLLLQREVCSL